MLKTIKILSWGLLGLVGLIAVVVLLWIAVNRSDETLLPEVEKVMHWQLPANAFDNNGFILMLGMGAPANEDPYATGRKILETELARYARHDPNIPEAPESQPFSHTWREQACDYGKERNCVDFYLGRKDAFLSSISQYKVLRSRYEAIANTSNYVEVIPPFIFANLPHWWPLMGASEMVRAEAVLHIDAGESEEGLRLLLEDMRMWRRHTSQSSSYIGRMMAIAGLQRGTRVVSELVHRYPKLAVEHAPELLAITAPISAAEFSMSKPLDFEWQMLMSVVSDIDSERMSDALELQARFLNGPLKLGYQPNATANLFYDWHEQDKKVASARADAMDAEKRKADSVKSDFLGYGIEGFYFKNPTGKFLAIMGLPYYPLSYIERQHDADGYLRLVALQVKLIADQVPASGIEEVVKTSSEQYRNPYTRAPMIWNASAGTLEFHGRQPANVNFERNRVFSVQVL